MKPIDLAIMAISTGFSIAFFSAHEAKAKQATSQSEIDDITSSHLTNSRRHSTIPSRLPEPVVGPEGDLRYPVNDIEAPGDHPYFDEIGTLHWEAKATPFQVVIEKNGYAWTAEDGLSEQAMTQLANNMDMLNALRAENETILRRQLVYHDEQLNEERAAIMEGELKNLTLPGIDGELLEIKITDAQKLLDENYPDEFHNGYIGGKLKDQPNSNVAIGLSGDSYNIMIQTPSRALDITSRNSGALIITEHNLEIPIPPETGCHCCYDGQHVGEVIAN